MQPSDLFGREILPESTFASEYGKLTLGHVIVPDFSSDEKGKVRLGEELDILISFMEEKDPLKKVNMAERIFRNEFSAVDDDGELIISNFASRSSITFSNFVSLLKASMRARLFEMGISMDSLEFLNEFLYDENACLSSGIVNYNDIPVIQPLSSAGGVYAHCLSYVFNPKKFCPGLYRDLVDQILADGIPTHNYLTWAFFNASNDEDVISWLSFVHRRGY